MLAVPKMQLFQPMPLQKRVSPFDDPDWIFELKLDGFRALAVIQSGRAELISRNGHPFGSFAELGKVIAASLPEATNTVIDGEIVCIDSSGRPQFEDLLFHRGTPCFFAFDLPIRAGKDCRSDRLQDRKEELRRLLAAVPAAAPLKYADHVDGSGVVLYERICQLDLEGIVAKLQSGPYVSERESSTWFKVLNPNYSQKVGREELFERDRRKEPVPGWHSCVLACAELEEAS
jgi:bifunctional non-homologous end joining protein LigD